MGNIIDMRGTPVMANAIACGLFALKNRETVALPTNMTNEKPRPTIIPTPRYIDHNVCTTPTTTNPNPQSKPPSQSVTRGP